MKEITHKDNGSAGVAPPSPAHSSSSPLTVNIGLDEGITALPSSGEKNERELATVVYSSDDDDDSVDLNIRQTEDNDDWREAIWVFCKSIVCIYDEPDPVKWWQKFLMDTFPNYLTALTVVLSIYITRTPVGTEYLSAYNSVSLLTASQSSKLASKDIGIKAAVAQLDKDLLWLNTHIATKEKNKTLGEHAKKRLEHLSKQVIKIIAAADANASRDFITNIVSAVFALTYVIQVIVFFVLNANPDKYHVSKDTNFSWNIADLILASAGAILFRWTMHCAGKTEAFRVQINDVGVSMQREKQAAKDAVADKIEAKAAVDTGSLGRIQLNLSLQLNAARKTEGGSSKRLREISNNPAYGESRRGNALKQK